MFEREAIIVSGATSGSSSEPAGGVDAIKTIGGYKIDVSFLDALYAGNKLTASQRDAILGGSDPSGFGLSQYDLYYLTCGRLGSKLVSGSAAGLGLILPYDGTKTYAKGELVIFTPTGQQQALYQAQTAVAVNTPPTDTTAWKAITSPGPTVLVDQDITNPALNGAGVAPPAATITAMTNAAGPAIVALIPPGRRYKATVSEVRPLVVGSMPGDQTIGVYPVCAEIVNVGDNSISLTVTPRWQAVAISPAAGLNAVAAGTLSARLRVELQ